MTYDVLCANGFENDTDNYGLTIVRVDADCKESARAQVDLPVAMIVEVK
jgi:hypothetical protein